MFESIRNRTAKPRSRTSRLSNIPSGSAVLNPRGDISSLRFPDGTWKEIERGEFHQTLAEFMILTLRNARSAGVFKPIAASGGPMINLTYDDGAV